MALIVEDGTGLANANAYASEAEVDAYHVLIGTPAASWADLSTAAKEAAIVEATQYIDALYHGSWQGYRLNSTQALDWVRSGVYVDGFLLDQDAVPKRLKDATAILALASTTETLLVDVSTPGSERTNRIKIGPMEKAVTYAGGSSPQKQYSLAEALLEPLTQPSAIVGPFL